MNMRGLIILCLSTLVLAVPQGYMYPQNQEQEHSAEGQLEAITPVDEIQPPEAPNTLQELPETQQKQQFSVELPPMKELSPPLEQPRHFTNHILPAAEGVQVPVPFAAYGPASKPYQHEPIVTKQFFIHSAPAEEEEEIQEKIVNLGQYRRNYNVVFIRAPTSPRRNTALKLIPAINEEKTIVYVLSKKNEASDVHTHVEEVPTTTTKPEVHFIEYKTHEEAKHAQEKIQADYEHLGGSTHVSNEGISPVTSVVGSLDGKIGHDQVKQQPLEHFSIEESVGVATSNGYLPPKYYYRN